MNSNSFALLKSAKLLTTIFEALYIVKISHAYLTMAIDSLDLAFYFMGQNRGFVHLHA
jgi:hypothetical protein